MAEEEKGHSPGCIILSFFIGGIIGAGIALLVAPKSGEETRKQIKEIAEDAKKKMEHYVEQVKGIATTTIEKGKEILEKEKSIVASAIEAGKEAYEKEKGGTP
ncbi:MAG: YtxH domain-containing protein [Syntrophorhabdaceae bacterium]|nr:YtxH domain-containing protein [Syntrophorhabdaceae bacterium]